MTAKILRNKGHVYYTRGVSRDQRARYERAINRRSHPKRRRRNPWMITQDYAVARDKFEKQLMEDDLKQFGEPLCNTEVSGFEELPFGKVDPKKRYQTRAGDVYLSSIVVSLALFDGDKMLFACSGIPLPRGESRVLLTRFVTSAHLVRAFINYRNIEDKFRVIVRLPDNTITDGFLGLYDDNIAIVTCLNLWDVHPYTKFEATFTCSENEILLAAGRLYGSGSLHTTECSLNRERPNTWVSGSRIMSKAVLGGPLLGGDGKFIGMNIDVDIQADGIVGYSFLPVASLCYRLKRFQILDSQKFDSRGYSLPEGVKSIVPSGFMATICRIKACGYPIPPPLVLEFNGRLLHRFEERFGEVLAWKGYPYGSVGSESDEWVWSELDKKVVRNISRRVVSLTSFKENEKVKVRSFACTGLFIRLKWHETKAARIVILTSASLVRSRSDDKIDNTLKIDVFLPPNQHGCGKLELYNLNYNIAIVSVENFNAGYWDISGSLVEKPSKEVVAIGRDTIHGPLMASCGEVQPCNNDRELDCKDLKFSTCKIKKAGIGGPLVDFDGRFVGMNFYDGKPLTPFLPRHKIVDVLRPVKDLRLEWGDGNPLPIPDLPGTTENRWPVPEPYWYHGELYRFDIPQLRGRTLN